MKRPTSKIPRQRPAKQLNQIEREVERRDHAIRRTHALGTASEGYAVRGAVGHLPENQPGYSFSASDIISAVGSERYKLLENKIGILRIGGIVRKMGERGVGVEELDEHWGEVMRMAGIREKPKAAGIGQQAKPSSPSQSLQKPTGMATPTKAPQTPQPPAAQIQPVSTNAGRTRHLVTVQELRPHVTPKMLNPLLRVMEEKKLDQLFRLLHSPQRSGGPFVIVHADEVISMAQQGYTIEAIADKLSKKYPIR